MSYYNYNNHHNHQSGYPQDYNNDGRIDFKDGIIHSALDVNHDGRVDFNDGVRIGQQAYNRHTLDFNGDGRVDYKDGIIYSQIQNTTNSHYRRHH